MENADMLLSKLIDWLNEMPVLSYNGGKYDINLIKHHLHNALNEIEEPVTFCIKKCSSYAAMKTKHFKFLDVMAYVAPGFSLEKFLKAYNCRLGKGKFPYNYLDSHDKLNSTIFHRMKNFLINFIIPILPLMKIMNV